MAKLVGKKILCAKEEQEKLLELGFGREDEVSGLELLPEEAVFLVNEKLLTVSNGKEELGAKKLAQIFSKQDAEFPWRLELFSDLRKKGFTVRLNAGGKISQNFVRSVNEGRSPNLHSKERWLRVYRRGKRRQDEEALWLLVPISKGKKENLGELLEILNTAQKMRKELVLVMREGKRNIFLRLSLTAFN